MNYFFLSCPFVGFVAIFYYSCFFRVFSWLNVFQSSDSRLAKPIASAASGALSTNFIQWPVFKLPSRNCRKWPSGRRRVLPNFRLITAMFFSLPVSQSHPFWGLYLLAYSRMTSSVSLLGSTLMVKSRMSLPKRFFSLFCSLKDETKAGWGAGQAV